MNRTGRWTVFSGPEHHSPVYTDLDAGPSGAPANSSYPISPLDVSTHTVLEPDLPAAELLCTEESLHSSCPSPGGDSEPTVLRPAPEYHGQDFSVSGAPADNSVGREGELVQQGTSPNMMRFDLWLRCSSANLPKCFQYWC